MDCRLKARVREMAEQLAKEHQQELAAAGTLVDLEELTCQIGDELGRLLAENELTRRADRQRLEAAECPTCKRRCLPDCDPEPTLLLGARGELAFIQPKYFCDRCRRSFFPGSGWLGPAATKRRDHQGHAKSRVGGRQ
jgi:hypothetical protein